MLTFKRYIGHLFFLNVSIRKEKKKTYWSTSKLPHRVVYTVNKALRKLQYLDRYEHELNTSGEDSGVHEGGHAKVGEGKNEDHGDINRNSSGKILRQPWAPGNDAG